MPYTEHVKASQVRLQYNVDEGTVCLVILSTTAALSGNRFEDLTDLILRRIEEDCLQCRCTMTIQIFHYCVQYETELYLLSTDLITEIHIVKSCCFVQMRK